jgi:hypothetical protein
MIEAHVVLLLFARRYLPFRCVLMNFSRDCTLDIVKNTFIVLIYRALKSSESLPLIQSSVIYSGETSDAFHVYCPVMKCRMSTYGTSITS